MFQIRSWIKTEIVPQWVKDTSDPPHKGTLPERRSVEETFTGNILEYKIIERHPQIVGLERVWELITSPNPNSRQKNTVPAPIINIKTRISTYFSNWPPLTSFYSSSTVADPTNINRIRFVFTCIQLNCTKWRRFSGQLIVTMFMLLSLLWRNLTPDRTGLFRYRLDKRTFGVDPIK
jgi:hypothetical protein